MKCHISLVLYFVMISFLGPLSSLSVFKKPSILISIIARNKAHTLPYTLSFLESLDYPKDRISLWIHSDNNIDSTAQILKIWLNEHQDKYASSQIFFNESAQGFADERGPADWSPLRFEHVIKLREDALNHARQIWADYAFVLDADAFLLNPNTLDLLISKNETIVAPLLKSDGMYSNFWAGMTNDYYYKRTDEYEPILTRKNLGCFPVPMVHSSVLIDLRRKASDLLTYDSRKLSSYDGPRDDIISFALGAKSSGIDLHICNDQIYGYIMVPLEDEDPLENDYQQLINLKLEMLASADLEAIPISKSMKRFVVYPEKDTLDLSRVYMINLERRPERRRRMKSCFDELGVDAEIIDAIDGRTLNESLLNSWGIKMMPGYLDPFHKRPMTMGEVGCFLSHYIVWNRIVEDGHKSALVLEDDVRFEPYFRPKMKLILRELKKFANNWDLVYLGRKRMQKEPETWIRDSKYLVNAGYSYWTVGYLLSAKGAKKLIEARPIDNLIPVDEYLPIMYDQHPREEWKKYFRDRSLVALSAEPLLLYPVHYTGESGYVSDTENSTLLANSLGMRVPEKEL